MKVSSAEMRRLLLPFITCAILSLQIGVAHAEPPRRIISLAPNITEILFAMGLGDRVIGDTVYCDFPDAARNKPKVGGMSNPSLEAVISLKPDMVVMTTDGNTPEFRERLRSFKIKTYVFSARKLSELSLGIREMGAALGAKEKADALSKEIEWALTKSSRSAVRRSQKTNVLFIIWPEPLIVAGPGTAIEDAISLLGYHNVAAEARTSYPKYSIEEIFHNPPDVIFVGKGHPGIKDMSKPLLEKLALVPAVKNRRVFFLSDSLYRLGPRVIQGIEEMAGCLN